MKRFSLLAVLAGVVITAFLSGCKPDYYQLPAEVGINPEAIEFTIDGGEATAKLLSNRDWKVIVDTLDGEEPWVTVNPEAGESCDDSVTVTFTVLPNTGLDRQTTVSFSTGTLTASVRISQEGSIKKSYTPIKTVRELYKGENVTVTEDWTIRGVVISNYRQESAGGLNNATSAKSMVVADSLAGIQLYCAANNTEFAFGDEVEVSLKGLELQRYNNGALQVNAVPVTNITKVAEGVAVTPIAISAAELVTGNYESRYVAVADVQKTSPDAETFVKNESHTSVSFTARTGETFVLFSSKYSTNGAENVPTGSGVLKGIAMSYGDTYQISVTSKEDYAGLTGERFASEVSVGSKVIGNYSKWNAIAPLTSFSEDFSSISEGYQEYTDDKWMFYTNDGSKVNFGWKTGVYNDTKYIDIAPYDSQLDQVVAYALLPKLNVKDVAQKTLAFKLSLYYKTADNSKLEVVVSENFTGDFESAAWTVVQDVTFDAGAATNQWTDKSVSLEKYADKGSLTIAFRYTGKSNTYRLDDIKYGEGGNGGDEGNGDEGDGDGDGDGDGGVEDEYTSNLTLPEETFTDVENAVYGGVVKIGEKEYPILKIGKTKQGGTYTFSSLPAKGNCTLSFYGVAWKANTCKLTVTVENGKIDGVTTKEIELAPNDGATGNTPFTITFASTDLYTLNLTEVTADTRITFSTTLETGPRGIFTGIKLKSASAE